MHSPSRRAFRFFGFCVAVATVITAALVGCSLYERVTYRAYRLGIGGEPLFTPYYMGRLAVIILLSLLLIGGLYRLRDRSGRLRYRILSRARRRTVYAVMATAAAAAILLIVNPNVFYRIALEDGPVEWLSALIPLAASAALFYALCRMLRTSGGDASRGVKLPLTALFAFALFVIGMEEISWMQRIFGIETPELFSANEQNETNLHNMYSSLAFNLVYRTAVFAGLIVLPFLVDAAPRNVSYDWLRDFLPSRLVAAASAPLVGFDYNQWNLFLGPLLLAIAVWILVFYARAAWERGDGKEMWLFAVLTAFVVITQAVFLVRGASVAPHTWVISEYRELFLAVGLGVFGWEVSARLVGRCRPARGSYRALPA